MMNMGAWDKFWLFSFILHIFQSCSKVRSEITWKLGIYQIVCRDLQKNFEVNLVDILDEYLEKLKVAETTTNLDVTNGRK